jgi:hypothetical protein
LYWGDGFFLQFKQRVVKSYPELFEEGVREQSNLGAIGSFGKKWGWYQSIFALAGGNIERFENITKLKAFECLTMLAFIKEKNDIEISQIKKTKI